jgi:hypothetical protein
MCEVVVNFIQARALVLHSKRILVLHVMEDSFTIRDTRRYVELLRAQQIAVNEEVIL